MGRKALTSLLRGCLLRGHLNHTSLLSYSPSYPAVFETLSCAVPERARLPQAWTQDAFAAQQHRCLTGEPSDLARRRLLAARSRRQKLHRPSQAAAAAAEHAAEPAQVSAPVTASQTQITPSEAPPSELQLAHVVNHPALIITRTIEWGNVIFGFEQANKYTVYDQDGNVVALMAEDVTGLGNELGRQLLRTRRSFTMTVLSADGSQIIFRVRRPMKLINSNMTIEDGQGNVVGEVLQRWHLLKRNYDLFLDKRQFAAIKGSFLAWEFEMTDEKGGTLALIDRNFQGFAKEIFTDAGKYVIHFGGGSSSSTSSSRTSTSSQQQAAQQLPAYASAAGTVPAGPAPGVTGMAAARTDVAVIPTQAGNQLVVARPMALAERMVALAAAISIDYDYFSRHSHHGGGWFPFMMPVPVPSPAPEAGEEGGGPDSSSSDAPAGAAAAGAAGGGFPSGSSAGGASAGAAGEAEAAGGGFPGQQEPELGQDAGFGQGQDDADSFRWDLGGGEQSGGAASEDGESGVGGLLKGIWDMVSEE